MELFISFHLISTGKKMCSHNGVDISGAAVMMGMCRVPKCCLMHEGI